MPRFPSLPLAALCLAGAALVGCASNARPTVPSPAAPGPAVHAASPATPADDPIASLIAESERHFAVGERELARGHLSEARVAFDLALNVLLERSTGARVEPRLRDHFDRLVDRISGLEATALAAGDGFAENPSEPASIDELLSTSAFDTPIPAPEADLTRTVETDLAATAHDIPIPPNGRVIAYVQLFTGRLREWMQASLQRGMRYLPMIQDVFRAEGLPLDLAYVPLVESAFKPNALSRAQAKGVWQFMRDTAKDNGLRHDWYIDERADPEKSTVAAARYLRWLHGMFDGDWHLALASYNGGPGRVQRALKRASVGDFWELSESTRYLPRETREYVPMILAAIIVARNPQQYGFDLGPVQPIAYEKVPVPPATDLRRLAEWIGAPVGDVQALNPELRRWTTPVRSTGYEVKVPVGTAALVRDRLAQTPPSGLSAVRWHTVKRGDTLSSLARRFSVSTSELASANQLSSHSRLSIGQELVIPRAPTPLASTLTARVDTVARASESTSARQAGASVYTVRKGDTLYSIARRHGLTVEALKSANRLRANRIVPGDRLTVLADQATQ